VELTFLVLQVEVVFMQPFHGEGDMVISQVPGVNHNIVNINNDEGGTPRTLCS